MRRSFADPDSVKPSSSTSWYNLSRGAGSCYQGCQRNHCLRHSSQRPNRRWCTFHYKQASFLTAASLGLSNLQLTIHLDIWQEKVDGQTNGGLAICWFWIRLGGVGGEGRRDLLYARLDGLSVCHSSIMSWLASSYDSLTGFGAGVNQAVLTDFSILWKTAIAFLTHAVLVRRYPYAVSLRHKNDQGLLIHYCSAFLIQSQLLLTGNLPLMAQRLPQWYQLIMLADLT